MCLYSAVVAATCDAGHVGRADGKDAGSNDEDVAPMKPTDGRPSPEARALHGHAPTAGSDEQASPAVRTPRFRLDFDVVLAANTHLQLDECLARIRRYQTFRSDWDLAVVAPRGVAASPASKQCPTQEKPWRLKPSQACWGYRIPSLGHR